MADVRKNQTKLSANEWKRLIAAIDAIRKPSAARPRYKDFVDIHNQGMVGRGMDTWGVHSMTKRGRNFLAWHRWFLRQFELRLQKEEPGVAIPYWDWIGYRKLPPEINRPAQLRRWHVTRQFEPDFLPTRPELTAVMRRRKFGAFQSWLEGLHGPVHIAVGGESGQMSGPRSPADPIFFLHHANIDRLWARWHGRHRQQRPKNTDEKLKPASMFGIKVAKTLKISDLGYRYR